MKAARFQPNDEVQFTYWNGMGNRWYDGTILSIVSNVDGKLGYEIAFTNRFGRADTTLVVDDRRKLLTKAEVKAKADARDALRKNKRAEKSAGRSRRLASWQNNLAQDIADEINCNEASATRDAILSVLIKKNISPPWLGA